MVTYYISQARRANRLALFYRREGDGQKAERAVGMRRYYMRMARRERAWDEARRA